MLMVKRDGRVLQFVSTELQNNAALVREAVSGQNGHAEALQYASEELRGSFDIVLEAVQLRAQALQWASQSLQNNTDIVMAAVECDGRTLQFASGELQDNTDIVVAAVRDWGQALQWASPRLKQSEHVVQTAIEENVWAFNCASSVLRADRDIIDLVEEQIRDRYPVFLLLQVTLMSGQTTVGLWPGDTPIHQVEMWARAELGVTAARIQLVHGVEHVHSLRELSPNECVSLSLVASGPL